MAPALTETTTQETVGLTVRLKPTEPQKASEKEQTVLERISQGGVTLPGIPLFSSVEKERRWMLEHMAGAFRVFARKGYCEGLAGHISLRDPEHKDCFWTNP